MSPSGVPPSLFQSPPLHASSSSHVPNALRNSHSFSSKVDEGYSGEEIQPPNPRPEGSGSDMRERLQDVKIPAWMTGLSDELREGALVAFCHPPGYCLLTLV